jgi:hypothetical protein
LNDVFHAVDAELCDVIVGQVQPFNFLARVDGIRKCDHCVDAESERIQVQVCGVFDVPLQQGFLKALRIFERRVLASIVAAGIKAETEALRAAMAAISASRESLAAANSFNLLSI